MPANTDTPLRIIPLGGEGEIGKNMYIFEYGSDIVVVDCGLMFPDEEMFGIDLVIPDVTYLRERKDDVRVHQCVTASICSWMEPTSGLEPETSSLPRKCSAN